ncbi:hypothetical protein EDC01DRAFT_629332 [Geopyxis carbonaria]|nr:hypothetical protein EDC01DRAFT_629332 [Geopyxis carbonaria]
MDIQYDDQNALGSEKGSIFEASGFEDTSSEEFSQFTAESETEKQQSAQDDSDFMKLEAERFQNVFSCMQQNGFESIGQFVQQALECRHTNIQRKTAELVSIAGFRNIFRALLERSPWGSKRRPTKKSDAMLISSFGIDLITLCSRIIISEMNDVTSDGWAQLPPTKMDPNIALNISIDDWNSRFQERAPMFCLLMRNIGGVNQSNNVEGSTTRPRRRPRNKNTIITVVISQLLFCRSQKDNAMQTILGYFFQASQTPRPVISVLNQIGLSVSYLSLCNGLKSIGLADRDTARHKVKAGNFFAICYDNLALKLNKAEETLINRAQFLQYTSAFVFFIHCPRPTMASGWLDAYHHIKHVQARNSGKIGIPRSLCIKERPDYSRITPWDMLFAESTGNYFPEVASVHIYNILNEYFGIGINKDALEYALQSILDVNEGSIDGNAEVLERICKEMDISLDQLTTSHVDIHCDMATNTLIEGLQKLRSRDMLERRMGFAYPVAGLLHTMMAALDGLFRAHEGRSDGRDLASIEKFTALLGRSRVRTDFNCGSRLILNLTHAYVLTACIHIADSMYNEECKDNNSMDYHVIDTLSALESWISTHDWSILIDRVVGYYCPLAKVGHQKRDAYTKARGSYDDKKQAILNIPRSNRTKQQTEFITATYRDKYIAQQVRETVDVAFYNGILFMQHGLMYKDLYTAVRSGCTGRVEKSLEMWTVFFQGIGKTTYASHLLAFQIDKMCAWTEEQHYIWLNNIVLNLKGSENGFLAVDETIELVNRAVQHVHNPRDNWQSIKFHTEHIPRNILTFIHLRDQIPPAMGAPYQGSSHSSPDDRNDIERVVGVLLENQILRRKPGRIWSSGESNSTKVALQESVDALDIGSDNILNGTSLAAIIEERQRIALQTHDLPKDIYTIGLTEWLKDNGHSMHDVKPENVDFGL